MSEPVEIDAVKLEDKINDVKEVVSGIVEDKIDDVKEVVSAIIEDKIDDVKEVVSGIVEKGHHFGNVQSSDSVVDLEQDVNVFLNKVETEARPWIHRLIQLFRLCRTVKVEAQNVKVAALPGDEPPPLEPSP